MLEVPSQNDFLTLLGIEPEIFDSASGLWSYLVVSPNGIELHLSFNVFEASIQTRLVLGENELMRVCHEGGEWLRFSDTVSRPELKGRFCLQDSRTDLLIQFEPELSISWSTLRTA